MKQFKSDLFKLGLYQIIGGAIGIILNLYTVFIIYELPWQSLALLTCITALYSYSILCGIFCVKDQRNAMKFSLVNQFLQLLSFAFFGCTYSYAAGLYISVGLDISDSFTMKFDAGISTYNLGFNAEVEQHMVTLNFVALALIYWISKRSKRLDEEETFAEISAIGSDE